MEHIFSDPTFWVAVSFFAFLGLLAYLKVPGLVGGILDQRAARIKAELDNAAQLRAEAEATLAKYREMTRNADQEAQQILSDSAKASAAMAAKAKTDLDAALERKMELAKAKIGLAEAQALAEVRQAAAEAAIAAARALIAERLGPQGREILIDGTIAALEPRLN